MDKGDGKIMKKCFLFLFFLMISKNLFSTDFSFSAENEKWKEILTGDARNFFVPFLFFDKKNESAIYSEVENTIHEYKGDWAVLVERNFDDSTFDVSLLTENKKNIHQTLYSLYKGCTLRKEKVIKHHSLNEFAGYKDNYHYVYDDRTCDASQYYLFICKNNVLRSYAFYGKGFSALEINQRRKIENQIDENVYELIKYLLTL